MHTIATTVIPRGGGGHCAVKIRRLVAVATAFFVATGYAATAPVEAAVVYITYTGTVRGNDPTNIFGQGTQFSNIPFAANFVFDTGSDPNNNFVFGGTNFNLPSPLIGPAVLTIGNVSVNINGDKVAEIFWAQKFHNRNDHPTSYGSGYKRITC